MAYNKKVTVNTVTHEFHLIEYIYWLHYAYHFLGNCYDSTNK